MYCNDPTSAKQAMCFHLDPQITKSLVQFRQMFYNVSKNDIYDEQARSANKLKTKLSYSLLILINHSSEPDNVVGGFVKFAEQTKWQCVEGLMGPVLSGTGFYLKRKALFGNPNQDDAYLSQPEWCFGLSNKFIKSLFNANNEPNTVPEDEASSHALLQEVHLLATSSYEKDTQWGSEIGFPYSCLLESTFTGYLLHCKGWTSMYCFPSRPCFLGCTTMNMKDALVQAMKWSSGLFGVAILMFCPLTYGMSKMSALQSMCYAYFVFTPVFAVLVLYATVPPAMPLEGHSHVP